MNRAGRIHRLAWHGQLIVNCKCPLCLNQATVYMRGAYPRQRLNASTHICRDGHAIVGFVMPLGVTVRHFPRRRRYEDDVMRELVRHADGISAWYELEEIEAKL